jgi:two-component system, response regulator RegA
VGTEPAESSEGPVGNCTTLTREGSEGIAVLVADGTPSGEALAAEFGQLGLSVRLATDLTEATAIALRERPALAVVELRLRRGCGLELVGRIKEGSPTTQTVVATMYGSIDIALASIRRGAVDCLTKPVTAVEILMNPAAVIAPGSLQAVPAWLGLQAARKRYIEDVLAHCGSLASTARALHIDRKSLRRMMRRFLGPSSGAPSEFLEERDNA